MGKQNLSSIGEAIEQFLKQNRLNRKIDSSSITSQWKEIAGEMIAKHTTRIFMKDHILYLGVDSSELKNELLFLKKQLISNINKHMQKEVIKEIILL